MGKKHIEKARILKNEALTPDIYNLILLVNEIPETDPGQFLNLYCNDGSRLLPRPISICEVDAAAKTFRLIYKVTGKGTEEFSKLHEGEEIEYMGPLGTGFSLEKAEKIEKKDKEILLIGGGVGVPPLLELAKGLKGKKRVLLGFESDSILIEEFKEVSEEVKIATTQGTEGVKGTVMDLLSQEEIRADQIYSCGPRGMLKAVQGWARDRKIPAELSLEERMACGIGACLVCTCKTKEGPHEADWNYQRVCKDGPVFNAEEVIFE